MKKSIKYCSVFHQDASETVAYNNPLFPVYAEYSFLSSYPGYSCISHSYYGSGSSQTRRKVKIYS